MGFGRTYTVPLAVNQPVIYGSYVTFEQPHDSEAVELGATYTKVDENKSNVENRLGSTYTLKTASSITDAEDYEYPDRSESRLPDEKIERTDSPYQLHSSTIFSQGNVNQKTSSTNGSPILNDIYNLVRDSSYNVRSQSHSSRYRDVRVSGESSHDAQQSGVSLLKRDTDTTSNDGSECTVMSLGQKIQLMASIQPKEQKDHHYKEENWDTEWKQLLRQNHELLLKLSSREDLHATEDTSDNVKTVLVHDSEVQTIVTEDAEEKELFECMGNTESPEVMMFSEFDEQSHFHRDCKHGEENEERECTSSESPECVLEDIIEESSHSDKSTPRTVVSNQDDIEKNVVKSDSVISLNVKEIYSRSDISTTQEVPVSDKSESMNKTTKEKPENPPSLLVSNNTDFSCTTDLPTYRSGTATSYLVRCRFPREKQMRPQPSKDLLEALQMIEDEERKVSETRDIGSAVFKKFDSTTRNESVVYDDETTIDTKQLYDSMAYGVESTETISSPSYR